MGGPVAIGHTAPATTHQHIAADSRNGLEKGISEPEASELKFCSANGSVPEAAVSLSGNACEPGNVYLTSASLAVQVKHRGARTQLRQATMIAPTLATGLCQSRMIMPI